MRLVCGLVFLLLLALQGGAQTPGGDGPPGKAEPPGGDEPKIPVIRLAAQPGRAERALRWSLLPDPLDLTPGNAAPVWVRAGRAVREVKRKITEAEEKWRSSNEGVPLKELPRDKVRELLEAYAMPLRLAEQAARKERCDWELPPLTFQNMQDNLQALLDDVQSCREIARLLGFQFRLALVEGNFDRAIRTLQTGFALARHIGESDLLIQNLVGIAIGAVMCSHLEELVQQPEAPNLYWALTTLPHPFIDIRHTMRYELDTVYRSFPALRTLSQAGDRPLPAAEVEALLRNLFDQFAQLNGLATRPPEWQGKLALTAAVLKVYPDAKRYLQSLGRTEEEIHALPALQVVGIFYLGRYDWWRDEILKWLSVPAWQALPHIEKLERELSKDMREQANPLLMIFPAVLKVQQAIARTERSFAGLRAAEALRLYAAAHGGKAPAKLADIKEVPIPLDPLTGKDMEAWYKVQDGTAVLEVPSTMPSAPWLGRRYELPAK
jgi:hypothetical protein